MKFRFFILFSLLFSSGNVFARYYSFDLQQNIVHVSVCSEPFELLGDGDTQKIAANDDSFKLDLDNEVVYWKDSEGMTKSKIYKLQRAIIGSKERLMFTTESNIYRITMTNETAVIVIMYKNNFQWC